MCVFSICLLGLALYFAIVSAAPYPVLPSLTSLSKAAKQPLSGSLQSVAFKIPCIGCLASGDDAVLDFEVQHPSLSSSTNLCDVPFALNGQPLTSDHDNAVSTNSLQVSSGGWSVDLAVQTYCTTPGPNYNTLQRAFFFNVSQIDDYPLQVSDAFTVVLDESKQTQVLVETQIQTQTQDQSDCADLLSSVVDETSSLFTEIDSLPQDDELTPADIDLAEHILLRRLHRQATKLRSLNEACRRESYRTIADCHRDISCVARVMSERIHNITLTRIKEIQESLKETAMVSKQRYEQYIIADGDDAFNFNVTSIESLLSSTNENTKDTKLQHPLVLALEILAAAIGLIALGKFLRRRFCSLRARVDRLADREERKRAKQFRCLARREYLRKKWVSLKGVFKGNSRNGGDEEKCALVIEAAADVVEEYIEEPKYLEDPEIGDAVGDLHLAHEFVAAMVSNNRTHFRQSFDAGSRVSSLPSYTEEVLPDYTSNPGSEIHISNGFRYTPSLAGGRSVNTAITPDSSVVVTPRCSRETLRTGTDFSID